MRRIVVGLAVVLGISAFSTSAHAQAAAAAAASANAGFSDPFFLYYSWYLPRQQFLANQPSPELIINQQAAARRENAMMDRDDLLALPEPLGFDELDPLRPFGARAPGRAMRTNRLPRNGISHQNLNGAGPSLHYNRVAGYYPSLRLGRGQNVNVFTPRRRGRGGGGGVYAGVPSATTGMVPGMGGMR